MEFSIIIISKSVSILNEDTNSVLDKGPCVYGSGMQLLN